MAAGEFSVVFFFADDTYHFELRFVDAETAVKRATDATQSVAARILKTLKRIIITDGGDHINWEWIHDRGLVFPPPSDEVK